MAAKKEKQEIDARSILLDTAKKLFTEQGFEAVSIRMLAKESGVNIAMVSYYFGSKEKLFEAIIEEHIPKTREMLLSFLSMPIDPWEKVSMALEAYVDRIYTNMSIVKMMYRELGLLQRREHSANIVNAIRRNWEAMQQIIEEGQSKGVFKKDIDIVMTLATISGTVLQMVKSPIVAACFLNENDENAVFSEENKQRMKVHLKQLMKAHLMERV